MADYVKDCNPDIIIVFGGTNDITYLDHIGTINDEPYTGGKFLMRILTKLPFMVHTRACYKN